MVLRMFIEYVYNGLYADILFACIMYGHHMLAELKIGLKTTLTSVTSLNIMRHIHYTLGSFGMYLIFGMVRNLHSLKWRSLSLYLIFLLHPGQWHLVSDSSMICLTMKLFIRPSVRMMNILNPGMPGAL